MEKLETGKKIKIGIYNPTVWQTSQGFYLDSYERTFTQFNIEKKEIFSLLGYNDGGCFPWCRTLEDLQKVYEYIISKDPNNKKTINFEDIIFPEGKQEDKFIVGKWYKRDTGSYVKFLELRYNIFISSEELLKSNGFKYFKGESKVGDVTLFSNTYTLLEDLSEIQSYLPKGHIDKLPVKKSLIFKKGVWYKYTATNGWYLKSTQDSIDKIFYSECIDIENKFLSKVFETCFEAINNEHVTDEEVPLSEIEKYIPNENIKREDLIVGQIYAGTWDVTKKVIFNYSGDLNNNNHIINNNGNYRFSGCFKNNYDVTFRLATKEEKDLLICKIPKETMKEKVNFIHGEYYVDRVNSGGSRIFKYHEPNKQLYYINTAVKCFFINNYDSTVENDSVPATQKEIDWLNKCIKANKFVPEDFSEEKTTSKECFVELTSLPEKWCIKRNKENYETINRFFNKPENNKKNYSFKGQDTYICSSHINCEQWIRTDTEPQKDHIQITYEQFKKWVMKEEEPDMQEILRQAIEKYPIGTHINCLRNWGQNVPVSEIPFIEGNMIWVKCYLNNLNLCLYQKKTWAQILSYGGYMRKALPNIYFFRKHYNEPINSSTNVEYSTKGTLPLHNVKKRLVLN